MTKGFEIEWKRGWRTVYAFTEHLGNCQGVVIMNLEADRQGGKQDYQVQAFPEKTSKGRKTGWRSKVEEMSYKSGGCFLVLGLFLFSFCILELQSTHKS